MPSLIAIALLREPEVPAWAGSVSQAEPRWVRLWANTTPSEVAVVLGTLAAFNQPIDDDIADAIHDLTTKNELGLPGGFGAAEGKYVIPPACCANLSDWANWNELISGGDGVWLGH